MSAVAVWELFEVFVDGGPATLGLEKRDLLPRVAMEDDIAPSLTTQVRGATASPHPEHLCGLPVFVRAGSRWRRVQSRFKLRPDGTS